MENSHNSTTLGMVAHCHNLYRDSASCKVLRNTRIHKNIDWTINIYDAFHPLPLFPTQRPYTKPHPVDRLTSKSRISG